MVSELAFPGLWVQYLGGYCPRREEEEEEWVSESSFDQLVKDGEE